MWPILTWATTRPPPHNDNMSTEVTSIRQTIATNAVGPKAATADGTSATQHSLADQIAADEYLRRIGAHRRQRPPIQLFQIQAPGSA